MISRIPGLPAVVAVLPALLLLGGPARGADVTDRAELEIAVVNGIYEDLDADLQPVRQGPVTLLIRSPDHQLQVHSNSLRLEKRADGLVDAAFEASIEGWGQLIIDLQSAAGTSTFEDRVEAKRQWVKLAGTVRLAAAPGGFEVTFLDFVHDQMGVQVTSEVSSQLVGACRSMVAMGFMVLDCDAISAALARVEVPLPEKGSRFLIRGDLLTEAEREVFARFAEPAEPAP